MSAPVDYVANQRSVNMRHSNGQIDTPTEEAITYAEWFGHEVKAMSLATQSVLDAGCRTGYTLPVLRKHFTNVVGCDIVPEFVAIAGTRGEAIEADIHALPFSDKEFDWVFCTAVIEHCHDMPKAANELFRVARVGVFLTADMQTEEAFEANPSHYVCIDTPGEWIDHLSRQGWSLVHMAVPSRGYLHGIWIRDQYLDNLKQGLSWYKRGSND